MAATLFRAQPLAGPGDLAPARRSLADQIARLERELAAFAPELPARARALGGPRLLTLSELEDTRDDLVERLDAARRAAAAHGQAQELSRRLREEMLLEPHRHAFVRVGNDDIGEPGCREWHVRPRFGLLGLLANWWRVCISSGCP